MRFILLFLIILSIPLWSQRNLNKVSIQLDWKYQFQFAGFIAAKEKGFYRDAGLNVELREYQPNIDIISDVLTQKATYGTYNSSIVVENSQIKPLVLLATYFQQSPLIFVAKKGIKHPSDIIGKTVMGTKDELKYSNLALLFNHFDISSKNTRFVDHTFKIDDFIHGKVDVMSAFRSNQLYQLDKIGMQYEIIDPTDYGFVMSAVNLFTSPQEAVAHPVQTEKFIKASNEGWKYALTHQDEIISLLIEKYHCGKSREALRFEAQETKRLMMTDFYSIGQTNEELVLRAYKQLMYSGTLNSEQKLGNFMFNDIQSAFKNGIDLTQKEKEYLLQKKTIRVCVDPYWFPLEAVEEGKHIGIAADVMKDFEHKLHIPFELVPVTSWQESINHAKNRECDIFSLASSTPDRLKYMNFTSAYMTLPIVMVTTLDKLFIDEIGTLEGKKLGAVKGYAITDKLKSLYPNLTIVEVASMKEGLKRVESGELYGYIDTLSVVSASIQKEYNGVLKVSSKLNEETNLGIGTRNDEPILHDIFEKLVHSVNEPMMQMIYNRYTAVVHETNRYFWPLLYLLVATGGLSIIVMLWNWLLQKKVTEHVAKNTEQEKLLFQKAKQAELGNMIANISHQWREPLSKLSSINLLTMAKLKAAQSIDEPTLLKQCDEIEKTIDFMSHTMQSFLEFYKKTDVSAPFNLMESIHASLFIIETKLLDNLIQITIEGDENVVISGIKNEWMQVWLNLMNNAIEALKTRQVPMPLITIRITDNEILFCDNGGGMELNASINGLGLQMCYEITSKYHAKLLLENNDSGLCARILLR